MNTPTRTPANTEAPASGGSKTLWAAMLVLVVVVLAMGATLIRIQSQPIEPRMSVLPQPARVVHASANDGAASASTPASASSAVLEQNKLPAPMDKAQVAIKNGANQAIEITAKPRPVLSRQPEPAVLRPPGVGVSNTATPESK